MNKKTYKLVNMVEALTAQNELLKHKNNNLKGSLIKEKGQYIYKKGLFK